MEPKWRQDGVRTAKNPKKPSNATKKRPAFYRVAPFESKKWPTWLQVGLPKRTNIDKKSMQKSINILMPLGVDFWSDFGGFLEGKWSQLGIKMEPKIDIGAKAEKATKH